MKEACVLTREFLSKVEGRKALKDTTNMKRMRQELNAILQLLLVRTSPHGIDDNIKTRAEALVQSLADNKR